MHSLATMKVWRRSVSRCAIALTAATGLIAAMYFPHDVDKPLSAEELERNRNYYAEAYKTPTEEQPTSEYETEYLRIAADAAEAAGIQEQVSDFVAEYGLRNGAVLDLGSGRGYLQDAVENYTGLDISSNVRRFYHKKFVLGSATAMPFPENSFDGGWSIWVLEHVPNPQQALLEIRRVMKNDAVFMLYPAWNCSDWAAQGYDVRPYTAFDFKGKLIKASIPVQASLPFRAAALIPFRITRHVASLFGATRLHYRLLQPNYKEDWEADSDALNSIDRYEMMLWFRSRGDQCLNCESSSKSLLNMGPDPLIIRVRK